jgi:hypothetical protein
MLYVWKTINLKPALTPLSALCWMILVISSYMFGETQFNLLETCSDPPVRFMLDDTMLYVWKTIYLRPALTPLSA